MDTGEKMVWMYEKTHGPVSRTNSCQIEVVIDHDDYMNEVVTLHHVKDGMTFAVQSKADLLFDYLTLNIKPV